MLGWRTIRMICNSRFCSCQDIISFRMSNQAYLEALILQHPLYSCVFAIGSEFCLENHTERAIPYDLALRVLHLLCLAREAILHLFTYNLCPSSAFPVVSNGYRWSLPPMRRLVKPAGRACVDISARQGGVMPSGYREYGGLEVSSRWGRSRRSVDESVLGGLGGSKIRSERGGKKEG